MSQRRVKIEIAIGIFLTVVMTAILIVYGINENQRMQLFDKQEKGKAVEVGAALFETNCSGCHGVQGKGVEGLWPPLNDPFFFNGRLKEVGWTGTQEDYIISTVSSGRAVSTRPDKYPGSGKPAMPAWSERYGGPLRDDQIKNIAAFVMNWQATAGEVPEPPTTTDQSAGTDITVELPAGDATRGEQIATRDCFVCHVTTTAGPAWAATADQPGIGDRAGTRIEQTDYTGTAADAEQYLFESIVLPGTFLVSPFQNLMPADFGTKMTLQDVADLIAYMLTLK